MPQFKAESSMDAIDQDAGLNNNNNNNNNNSNSMASYQQKAEQMDEQSEMRLICFPMLDNRYFTEIALESTMFAISKDNMIQLKLVNGNDESDQIICQEQFNSRIKGLKFQIYQKESIIFIHLEDEQLYMWRWQQKESYKLVQQNVLNFDVFVYSDNLFFAVQKGDMHIQVYNIEKKLISNLENIRPKEDIIGENCSIQNIVAWGSQENQQWYICCNSGNYFWAYSLNISDSIHASLASLDDSITLPPFKIIYEAFSEDQQEIFKMRLHKNQQGSQEIIGASDSGFLYIFDILKGQQLYFKTKNQGEKQMQDIQVFHPYNTNHIDQQLFQRVYDEPKIILCYDNFIRIRKHKKLQFPHGMQCATLEVKISEIIVYYVLNNQDTIHKHSIAFNS